MGLISPPTYDNLNTKVADVLFELCQNTTTAKYNAIPDCFKPNKQIDNPHTFESYGGNITESVSETILTNITQSSDDVTKTFLKNKIRSYINTSKYPDNETISMPNFIGYYNNICDFCARNVGYITSQHSTNVYLIFEEDAFVEDKHVYPNMVDDKIYAESVALFESGSPSDGILNVLSKRINDLNNCRFVKYKFTFND